VHIVKKIYLFFVCLLLIGCGSNIFNKPAIILVSCPEILFSSEHKIYTGTNSDTITFENINYKAEINNAIFSKKCEIENNIFATELSILFISNPLNNKIKLFTLPYYMALLDKNKNLIDIQYFSTVNEFKKNIDTDNLIETEITNTLFINHEFLVLEEISTIVLGFMLDKNQINFLN